MICPPPPAQQPPHTPGQLTAAATPAAPWGARRGVRGAHITERQRERVKVALTRFRLCYGVTLVHNRFRLVDGVTLLHPRCGGLEEPPHRGWRWEEKSAWGNGVDATNGTTTPFPHALTSSHLHPRGGGLATKRIYFPIFPYISPYFPTASQPARQPASQPGPTPVGFTPQFPKKVRNIHWFPRNPHFRQVL